MCGLLTASLFDILSQKIMVIVIQGYEDFLCFHSNTLKTFV